jgi:ATP-dependent Clp protease ATP-binding subunit ClpA
VCQGTGRNGSRKCKLCGGLAMTLIAKDHLLYFGEPITRYDLALGRMRRLFNRVRVLTIVVIGLNFWVWAGVLAYKAGLFHLLVNPSFNSPINFLRAVPSQVAFLFWLGVSFFSYCWYRTSSERAVGSEVEPYDYNYPKLNFAPEPDIAAARKEFSSKKRLDIAKTFTPEAINAIAAAYGVADKSGSADVTPIHLLYGLLSFNRVSNIFVRLGILGTHIQKQLGAAFKTQAHTSAVLAPRVSPEFAASLFGAYTRAYETHQEYVSVTELLEAAINASSQIQEILFDLNIDKQKLANVVEWARVRERLHRQYMEVRSHAWLRSKHGIDRAMTAVATPFLNQFSQDVTEAAQFGRVEACVARDHEIDEILRVIEGGVANVLLVGDFGAGKRTIVDGIAQKMISDDVPARLKDKRLVRLSTSSLLSGTSPAGAVERLIRCMYEISRAGNIILFIHNIHELVGVSAGGEGGKSLDVASSLAEYITGGRFMTIATTTPDNFAQAISHSGLGNVFTKVDVNEMDENQAIQVLESKVGYVEYKHQVFFAYAAIEKAVQLSKRFLHEQYLPGSALEVMSEAASFTHSHKGLHALVTAEEVNAVVAEKTHIPVTSVTSDETNKLLHLEEVMHQRVIGQDEAVELIAAALRRSRAEMRAKGRPIANFLFLGPTGVGKTELAKTIAEVYFGGEDRMVRLDMSEYQDKSSIYRLIGAPNQKGTGVLTEAVRRSPFTLLLLDEIEKADKDVLNLFLQVMDDGRLTDSTGRVVDFTNVIIIATSNAGTSYVQEQLNSGVASSIIKEHLLHGGLNEYFRPEFLNRFDGIVLFKALSSEDIKQVAGLMLKRVAKDLEAKGIRLEVGPGALDFLAKAGFDPDFGARPMRRALEDKVENKLADLLLSGQLHRHDTARLLQSGEIEVTRG